MSELEIILMEDYYSILYSKVIDNLRRKQKG